MAMTEEEFLKKLDETLNKGNKSLEDRFKSISERLADAMENGASKEYIAALKNTQAQLLETIKLQNELVNQGRDQLQAIAKSRPLATEELEIINKLTADFQELAQREAKLLAARDEAVRDGTQEGIDLIDSYLAEIQGKINELADEAQDKAFDFTNQVDSDLSKAIDEMKQLYSIEDNRLEIAKKINQLEKDSISNEKELAALKKQDDARYESRLVMWNAIKAAFGEFKNQVKDGADMWMKYNAQAISDAKRLGITSLEGARAYTRGLMEDSKQLSRNFGMSAEQAMKMRENYAKVTGRATMLTREQMEDIAASSKLMGEETVQSAIQMMDNMGSTSQTTMELMDKNYARAVNSGLDTVKASEAFVKNMSLANKLTFRNGVDGISKMTILSQRIKLNLQEVANVADKFSTIEGALQGSAQLQMLGGAGAAFGGNPMQMMYEALSDPEALFQRMGNMFADNAIFNRRTGEAEISPLQMQIMREQAKALGMNPDEAVTTAKQQAKLRDIEAQWRLGNSTTYNAATEEQKASIMNKAEYNKETRQWEVSYMTETGDIRKVGVNQLTASDMEEMMKDNIEPVQDIRGRVKEIAMTLVGTKERLDSMKDQWKTGKAQALNGIMETGDDALRYINKSSIWDTITSSGLGTWLGIAGQAAVAGLQVWGTAKITKAIGKMLKGGKAGGSTPISSDSGTKTITPNTSGVPKAGVTVSGGGRMGAAMKAGGTAGRNAFRGVAGKVGAAASVATGAYVAYSGWQDAGTNYNYSTNITNNLAQRGRITANEQTQRNMAAQNRRMQQRSEAVGEGVGAAVGGVAGIAAGAAASAAAGAAIGSVVPGLGTAIGLGVGALVGVVGAWLGKKAGGAIGSGLQDHTKDDTIAKHLEEINDSDEEENLRRIVLPIESIDYNVALIAKQLGVSSATPARGNVYLDAEGAGDIQVDGVPLEGGYVNPVDAGYQPQPQMYHGGGSSKVDLNITGTINLNCGGNIGKLNPEDFKQMIMNNPELQRALADIITGRQAANGNAARTNNENASNRLSTVYGANDGGM